MREQDQKNAPLIAQAVSEVGCKKCKIGVTALREMGLQAIDLDHEKLKRSLAWLNKELGITDDDKSAALPDIRSYLEDGTS